MAQYRFVYNIRDGKPGFTDYDSYNSPLFDNFEECFREYVKFKPHKFWNNLRHITSEYFIYKNNGEEHINSCDNGMLHYSDSIKDLGITEEQFDIIIEKIKSEDKPPTENNLKDPDTWKYDILDRYIGERGSKSITFYNSDNDDFE